MHKSAHEKSSLENLFSIARQFTHQCNVIDVGEFGKGNINDTFLVTTDAAGNGRFILQRINTRVFRRPELVMRNMLVSTDHMLQRMQSTALAGDRRWEVPVVILTPSGEDHRLSSDGSFWRAVAFIGDSQSFAVIRDAHHAQEVGYALGLFHTLLSDLPPGTLADTLQGFHITPHYLRHYDEVLATSRYKSSPEVNYCLRLAEQRRDLAPVLEHAKAKGRLFLRIIHGDPKTDNVMMDIASRRAVSIVDLDTVKPGLVHYDIGDCLRSACNQTGEDTQQWEAVRFDADIAMAVLKGYCSVAREFLTENDFDYFFESIRLIAFELALRFFTDYLEGDVYFRVRHPDHNLARALVQFRLTQSIESQEAAIRSIIRGIK
jgi:Ser/Thr protein kinase RdoA (MazF antagonist)